MFPKFARSILPREPLKRELFLAVGSLQSSLLKRAKGMAKKVESIF